MASVGNGVHVSFEARTRDLVDEFYRVAPRQRRHRGRPAGPAPRVDAKYYGAFARDPYGNKIEAVTFQTM